MNDSIPPILRPSLGSRLRNWLLAGIIVLAPVLITAYVVWQVVDFFDGWMNSILPTHWNPETYLPFSLPGLGLLMAIGLLIFVGWSTAGFVGRSIVRLGEQSLARTPVIRSLYGTLKQLFETLFAQKGRAFREVVLVEFPAKGHWSLGFLTGDAPVTVADEVGGELVSVFIPLTPNPTSGFIIFVETSQTRPLAISIDEAFKMILSFGIVGGERVRPVSPAFEQSEGVRPAEEVE